MGATTAGTAKASTVVGTTAEASTAGASTAEAITVVDTLVVDTLVVDTAAAGSAAAVVVDTGTDGSLDHAALGAWIADYERCWRTAGTDGLADLFAATVRYRPSPWSAEVVGLDALARFWDAERYGPQEAFALTSQILAVDGRLGVVRVEVDYATGDRWRDLWLVGFDAHGRCTTFEEWPFAPEQPDGHESGRPDGGVR